MTESRTFRTAARRWQAWRTTTALAEADPVNEPFDDAAGHLVDAAELVILTHTPVDGDELALQLEVIIWNIETGGRADGLDMIALKRLQPLLAVAVQDVQRSRVA